MNAISVSTLRPGLLVSLRTSLSGNVKYAAQTIEREHVDDTGALRAKWQTERVITDPGEHERAVKARGKARSLITAVCAQSAFGLLCPASDDEKLQRAISDAREVVNQFNGSATLTRISVNVIAGRIAADDVEAVRAITGEVRELLDQMERGVRNLEVETIREAASKAKGIASMLSPAASQRALAAVEAARAAARAISKAGETAAVAVDQVALDTIRNSRLAFLDLDDGDTVELPTISGAAIDFDVARVESVVRGQSLFADLDL